MGNIKEECIVLKLLRQRGRIVCKLKSEDELRNWIINLGKIQGTIVDDKQSEDEKKKKSRNTLFVKKESKKRMTSLQVSGNSGVNKTEKHSGTNNNTEPENRRTLLEMKKISKIILYFTKIY